LGERSGVPLVLAGGRSLECLNGVRRPDLWGRLVRERLRQDLAGTAKDLAREVAGALGLELDWGGIPVASEQWTLHSREGEWSLLEVLSSLTSEGQISFVLEGKTLRVVPADEAAGFWARWWAAEN